MNLFMRIALTPIVTVLSFEQSCLAEFSEALSFGWESVVFFLDVDLVDLAGFFSVRSQ
jgi:hypothetical protein